MDKEISFVNRENDYLDLQLYFLRNNPQLKRKQLNNRITILISYVVILVVFLLAVPLKDETKITLTIFMFLYGFVHMALFAHLQENRLRKGMRQLKHGEDTFGPKTVGIVGDSIECAGEGDKTIWKLDHVSRIVDSGPATYIFSGDTQAIIIPHREGIDREQIHALTSEIQRHIEKLPS